MERSMCGLSKFVTLALHIGVAVLAFSTPTIGFKPNGGLALQKAPNASAAPLTAGPKYDPIKAVAYAPHLIGESFFDGDVYASVYRRLHRRDLKLIRHSLKADTILIRPWRTDKDLADSQMHDQFAAEIKQNDLNVIPTFQLNSWYVKIEGSEDHVDPTMEDQLADFADSLEVIGLDRIVGWTVDLSLTMKDVPLAAEGGGCEELSKLRENKHFARYLLLISAVAAVMKDRLPGKHFYLPLDLDSATSPQVANTFMTCVGKKEADGGWGLESFFEAWVLSISLPLEMNVTAVEQMVQTNFGDWVDRLDKDNEALRSTGKSAIYMLGSGSVQLDPINSLHLIEDFGTQSKSNHQQAVLKQAWSLMRTYFSKPDVRTQGLIIDEWADDWDRGRHGLFAIADGDEEKRNCGGRYRHDATSFEVGCLKERAVPTKDPTWSPAVEYFGLTSQYTVGLWHCITPRFGYDGGFTFDGSTMEKPDSWSMCEFMEPAMDWLIITCVILALAVLVQVITCNKRRSRASSGMPTIIPASFHASQLQSVVSPSQVTEGDEEEGDSGRAEVQTCIVSKLLPELREEGPASVIVKLRSLNVAAQPLSVSLKAHLTTQSQRFDSQVLAEMLFVEAYNGSSQIEHQTLDTTGIRDHAVRTMHARVLEGFECWAECAKSDTAKLVRDRDRPTADLYSEAVLLRLLESLGEHVINAPERLSHLLEKIIRNSNPGVPASGKCYIVDYDELHDGLLQMQNNSNPYQGGLNFDDINESGLYRYDKVQKTFREPRNLMVVLDFVLNYRAVIAIKMWCFLIACYLYLESGQGQANMTSGNGSFLRPQWERSNLLQYGALCDALVWAMLQLCLFVYRTWQHFGKISLSTWGHLVSFTFSVAGFALVFITLNIKEKPQDIFQPDPRKSFLCGAEYAVLYFVARIAWFVLTHRRRKPLFVNGTPEAGRRGPARDRKKQIKRNLVVFFTWVCILIPCILFEAYMIMPITSGLDWSHQCGLNFLEVVFPSTNSQKSTGGACADRLIRSDCVACSLSVVTLWSVVFVSGVGLDVYYFFYVFGSVAGFVMGHRRGLNNLKNPMRTVDLRQSPEDGRPIGAEAVQMHSIFGDAWPQVWLRMVEGLYTEDLLSDAWVHDLCFAAGVQREGSLTEPVSAGTSPELFEFVSEPGVPRAGQAPSLAPSPPSLASAQMPRLGPINLANLPEKASERLTTFFGSLSGILKNSRDQEEQQNTNSISGSVALHRFYPQRDALSTCHVGTVPSLSQIIPAYNEDVIPNAKKLRQGNKMKDAGNQKHDDTSLLTKPALGDGINTNLGFIITQNLQEWVFLASRLNKEPQMLYNGFMQKQLEQECEMEVRIWAAHRSQTVAKTIIGAMQYQDCLSCLPNFRRHYNADDAEKGDRDRRSIRPRGHAELILAHQTFGSSKGYVENDKSVLWLMKRYRTSSFYLVFDYDPKQARREIKRKVEEFMLKTYPGSYRAESLQYASCKAQWNDVDQDISLLEVLPRYFPLLIGVKGYQTQGKASNQLNGLRFSTGHVIQAMDANMGVFIGEAFKIPFVMRRFLPPEASSRTIVQSRYIGFRERIFTYDDGTVGRCHAAAEWTFGTIFQRFLSGLGARMHYGHPDFVDGFWASNRGGMSKCSPSVNLSEDIFAGFNCKMREERCPHIDYLEFLKGREATLLAASNFFAKIAGGSVGMMRSRDLQRICENVGVLNCGSFYFASTAFYVSNLLVDLSIYLYVVLFVTFTLASQSIGSLDNLGSTLSMEWCLALGILSGFPQLFELILEHGACAAVVKLVPQIVDTTIFFMFQNKTLASAVRSGSVTGKARYLFTGRPLANHHHTWRDNYLTYCHSHFFPAFLLLTLIVLYHMLTGINQEGTLPMVLVFISGIVWIIAPVIFTPFPTIGLLKQDLLGFWDFIVAPLSENTRSNEVENKLNSEDVRSLTEWAYHREADACKNQTWQLKFAFATSSSLLALLLVLVVPANILDLLYVFLIAFAVRWLIVIAILARTNNNLLTFFRFVVWAIIPLVSWRVIGVRGGSSIVEYGCCFFVFLAILNALRMWSLTVAGCFPKRRDAMVRFAHDFFMKSDLDIMAAVTVLLLNTITSLFLVMFECSCCLPRGLHTWWLLNKNAAHAAAQKREYVPGRTHPLPKSSNSNGGSFNSFGRSGSWLLGNRGSRQTS